MKSAAKTDSTAIGRRIVRTEAICLRTTRTRETSKLVTFFSFDTGKLTCLAKGARGPRSKFGAGLEQFAVSKIIYYYHQMKTIYTISDAELVRSFPELTMNSTRFLAAEQLAEFLLRTVKPHNPAPRVYRLTITYLAALETADSHFPALVGSFLLKATSFLGFRPELRRCLRCHRPINKDKSCVFDPEQGGVFCSECGQGASGKSIKREQLQDLVYLLYTPVKEIAESPPAEEQLSLILQFVSAHIDPLLLNSFNWNAFE